MMVLSCCAYGCTNRYDKNRPEVRFHRFPFARKGILQRWISAICRKNWEPTKFSVVCSDHFKPDDFEFYLPGGNHRLKQNAVPSVFNFSHPTTKRRVLECTSSYKKEEEKSNQPLELEIQHNNLEEQSKPTIAELEVGLCQPFNDNSLENKESKPSSEELEEKWEESKPSIAELDAYQSYGINSLEEAECEDRKPSIAELESVAERHLACQLYMQGNMPPPDDASECIVPESEPPLSSEEPCCQYVQPKLEPLCSPGEASDCSISNHLACDSFLNANETCPDDEFNHLENGFQLSLSEEDENTSHLISGVENDHLYSYISPTLLKERIDLVCNHLILAKRKLKTDRQRNKRARETISKLIGTVINLQRQSLLH